MAQAVSMTQDPAPGVVPYQDMRALIATLESAGKLRRVKKEVDPAWEIGAMARWIYQGF